MRSVRKLFAFAVLAALLVTAAGCGGSSSSSSGGVTNIVLWHGYVDTEGKAMKTMVAEFNASHPKIHVTAQFYGNSDYALQKVLTSIAGGHPPDIAYLYGSWAANIAQSPKTLALNSYIKNDPSFHWNDFWPSEREVATVDGRIVGVPALVDNLALVYNKKLFRAAGIPFPTANWTWDDLRAAAKKLTDPAKKQFGWAYVNDASEDTVWRFEALLWQAGGEILSSDGHHAAFDSPAGVKALTLLQQMAVQDHSVYLDSGNDLYANLFNSGHIGMLYTGPWDLSQASPVSTLASRSCPPTRTTRPSRAPTTGCSSTTARPARRPRSRSCRGSRARSTAWSGRSAPATCRSAAPISSCPATAPTSPSTPASRRSSRICRMPSRCAR